jgi:hypothetical protein
MPANAPAAPRTAADLLADLKRRASSDPAAAWLLRALEEGQRAMSGERAKTDSTSGK